MYLNTCMGVLLWINVCETDLHMCVCFFVGFRGCDAFIVRMSRLNANSFGRLRVAVFWVREFKWWVRFEIYQVIVLSFVLVFHLRGIVGDFFCLWFDVASVSGDSVHLTAMKKWLLWKNGCDFCSISTSYIVRGWFASSCSGFGWVVGFVMFTYFITSCLVFVEISGYVVHTQV